MHNIEQLLKKHGLDDYKEAILKECVPAIHLKKERIIGEMLPIGSSKFGGNPDLPTHLSFPTYEGGHLSFLAQINLAEVKSVDRSNQLPETGILYFFYDCEEQPWCSESGQEDGFKVLYYDGNVDELTSTPYPEVTDEYFPLPTFKITFSERLTFPEGIEKITSDEDNDKYYEFQNEVLDETDFPLHMMFGHPFTIQGDVFEEVIHYGSNEKIDWHSEEMNDKSANQVLLFQMDSDEKLNLMWGDSGMIYFCIDKFDLQHKRFENTNHILQCY